jgi:hypothetical protein
MSAQDYQEAQPDKPQRKRYEKPRLRVIELALEETMAEGCKLGTDPVCLANFEAGS